MSEKVLANEDLYSSILVYSFICYGGRKDGNWNREMKTVSEKDKEKWAKEHACRLQQLFKKWQKPLGIDGKEYRKHLTKELGCYYCDEPLLKSLVESIA